MSSTSPPIDWLRVLGVAAGQALQLLPFVASCAPSAFFDFTAFDAAIRARWELQWKSHLIRDLLAPWLQPCVVRDVQRVLGAQHMQSVDAQGKYWLYDSSHWEIAGANRVVAVLHGTSHDVLCVGWWLSKNERPHVTYCDAAARVADHRLALDRVFVAVVRTHQVQLGCLTQQVSLVMEASIEETISIAHPLRPALQHLSRRMRQNATVFKQAVQKGHASAAIQMVREVEWDVRQRISRRLGVSDVTTTHTSTSPGYRTMRRHFKVTPLNTRTCTRQALDQLTQHNLHAQQLLPFLERVRITQRIRDDAITRALQTPQAAHAAFQLRYARRELVEDGLLHNIGQLQLNTYESIQLNNWSRVLRDKLRLETLIELDPARACPYRAINLLADLIMLLSECQDQLAQFQPALWEHAASDNLFDAISRISSWVQSRSTTTVPATVTDSWLEALVKYVEQHAIHAAALSPHTHVQPEHISPTSFRI